MGKIRAIETIYRGHKFRSRLEARWAVFFDACGVEWEYEPEGFELRNGLRYLPDFKLFNVRGRNGGPEFFDSFYAEVKGEANVEDVKKIELFVFKKTEDLISPRYVENPLIILGRIPNENTIYEIGSWMNEYSDNANGYALKYFSFETIDGDCCYTAIPCISKRGCFELLGPDYIDEIDEERTLEAYAIAKKARFEFNKKQNIQRIVKKTELSENVQEVLERWDEIINETGGSLGEYIRYSIVPVSEENGEKIGLMYNNRILYEYDVDTYRQEVMLRAIIKAIEIVTGKRVFIDIMDIN